MERLILMRHGDAERPAPGLEDFDRGLTAEGRAESRGVGKALAEAGLEPDLGLVSAARRAVETWDAAAEAFEGVKMTADSGLYAASSAKLAAAARAAGAHARVLMLVGHNPGIHQFALHLAHQSGANAEEARTLHERFPTGSAAVFRIGMDGRAAFERLLLAKHHRKAAK